MRSFGTRLVIAVLIALALTILPLPDYMKVILPSWILFLLLYLQAFLPTAFTFMLVVFLGLSLDVLLASVMGEHVFALSLVLWIANAKARRFQFFPIGQQMALIGLYCFMYGAVIMAINAFLGFNYSMIRPVASAVLAILFWPWIKVLADEYLFVCKRLI